MKRIILPTDFSDYSYHAICFALELFKNQECTFYLMNTYTPAIYQAEYVLHSPGLIGLGDIYQENSLTQLKEMRNRLTSEFNNKRHIFIEHSAFNTLVDEIVETSKNENANLVIMGTQGATGAKEILIGTNTVHVIKKSCCPVIAIPPNLDYIEPKAILFPTDLEIDYQKEQLKEVLDIAKDHRSKIAVMHVLSGYDLSEIQQKNKVKLDRMLEGVANRFHGLPNQGVITAINNFQLEQEINFLVMIQNRHTFLERLFIEPIIKKMGFHVGIPFMVIPSHKNN
ncbi:MAG: universal stress protein [Maribacter sp.]|nr:universal stress protein [Maribacter sp.]